MPDARWDFKRRDVEILLLLLLILILIVEKLAFHAIGVQPLGCAACRTS